MFCNFIMNNFDNNKKKKKHNNNNFLGTRLDNTTTLFSVRLRKRVENGYVL